MSDTPRTDEARLTTPFIVRQLPFEVVKADDMEQLERELAEEKAAHEMTACAMALWGDERDKLRAENEMMRDALHPFSSVGGQLWASHGDWDSRTSVDAALLLNVPALPTASANI